MVEVERRVEDGCLRSCLGDVEEDEADMQIRGCSPVMIEDDGGIGYGR